MSSKRFLSINRKKIKRGTKLGQLHAEYTRNEENAGRYDDGKRNIDVSRTRENVTLFDQTGGNIDDFRRDRLSRFDELRASRSEGDKRRIRSDAVDVVSSVIQPSKDFIESLPREEQIQFFRDCLSVMEDDPNTFGETLVAVIHFDESTPHMQVMSSALDKKSLSPNAKRMFGNKSKMSSDQTAFVRGVQGRGWQVERGIKRIDSPEYQNFKDESLARGAEPSRFEDLAFHLARKEVEEEKASLEAEKSRLRAEKQKVVESYQKSEKYHKDLVRAREILEKMQKEFTEGLEELREQNRIGQTGLLDLAAIKTPKELIEGYNTVMFKKFEILQDRVKLYHDSIFKEGYQKGFEDGGKNKRKQKDVSWMTADLWKDVLEEVEKSDTNSRESASRDKGFDLNR